MSHDIMRSIAFNKDLETTQLFDGSANDGKYIAILHCFDAASGWAIIGDTSDSPRDTAEEAFEYGLQVFASHVKPDVEVQS